jgi:3-deoxy-D-manno-octulosonate 8-phosphate phosphatase (KDO 8-P phosphatase)
MPKQEIDQNLLEQARAIQLLALDVDGVMTPGEIIYIETGEEIKMFNAKDGHGIALWIASGFKVAIITGRVSKVTEKRAQELRIPYVFQGSKNKIEVLEALLKELDLPSSAVAYMGDDTNDAGVLRRVGLATCPSDSHDAILPLCHWQSQYPGGKGAVRELCDLLFQAKDLDPNSRYMTGFAQ